MKNHLLFEKQKIFIEKSRRFFSSLFMWGNGSCCKVQPFLFNYLLFVIQFFKSFFASLEKQIGYLEVNHLSLSKICSNYQYSFLFCSYVIWNMYLGTLACLTYQMVFLFLLSTFFLVLTSILLLFFFVSSIFDCSFVQKQQSSIKPKLVGVGYFSVVKRRSLRRGKTTTPLLVSGDGFQ